MTRFRKHLPVYLASFLVAGCQRAPSVDILGSFFPVWIFCTVLGIVAAALARELLIRAKYDSVIGPPVIIYPCLAATVAFVLWLIFFR